MNKRQWKKNYKKIHGYNPRKSVMEMAILAVGKMFRMMANGFEELIKPLRELAERLGDE